MKNIFTFSVFLLSALYVSAQSLEFTYLENTPWGNASSIIVARAHIKNISGSAKDIKVRRFQQTVVPGSSNYFCWDVCYGPSTSISLNPLTIEPGDTNEAFYADYEGNGNVGLSTIQYCFYDQQNNSDSICFIAVFNASATGVETNLFANENKISNAYPNPASGSAKITYSVKSDAGNSKFVLHNMLGAVVKTIDLNEKLATLEIHLNGLQSGIYFYSLVVDNKTIATKKLVVTH